MRKLLGNADVYQKFQDVLAFSDSRRKAIDDYVTIPKGAKIVDIGCGPGRVIDYLPSDIQYTGFDVDQNYIDHARRKYGDRGEFFCEEFDEEVASRVADADIVMLNGVLHHLDDESAAGILANASAALASDGVLFALDGCYRAGQNRLAKKLLDLDRGKFVREEHEYASLLDPHFETVTTHIREDISPLPYTFVISLATNGEDES